MGKETLAETNPKDKVTYINTMNLHDFTISLMTFGAFVNPWLWQAMALW